MLRRAPSEAWLTPEMQEEMRKIENCLNCGQCRQKCPYELNTPEAVVRKSGELINELEKSGMMEARALLDDLRVICTGEDSSFEEPEEYMERMKEK